MQLGIAKPRSPRIKILIAFLIDLNGAREVESSLLSKNIDTSKSRLTIGHIHNFDENTKITDKIACAGIDKSGKLYRRKLLRKDGKSGKTR